MKKILPMACLLLPILSGVNAQKIQHAAGPYTVRASAEFTLANGYFADNAVSYGDSGMIQVNTRGLKSFNFQRFSNELKLVNENTVDLETRLNKSMSYGNFIKLNSKAYLFVREVFGSEEKEGISALEFSTGNLDFVGGVANLFKSSGMVQTKGTTMKMSYFGIWIPPGRSGIFGPYDFKVSQDRKKFMFTYSLKPREVQDEINKEVVGIQVFDEDLNRIWGGEYEMPYTEAMMDNVEFLLADDSKVYLLAKVYEGQGKRGYHLEVLAYEAGKQAAQQLKIEPDNHVSAEERLYETANHEIALAGLYATAPKAPAEGAYLVKMQQENGKFAKTRSSFFKIPSETLKAFTSPGQRKVLEKKERKGLALGVRYLSLHDVYFLPDGSARIVAEQYRVGDNLTYKKAVSRVKTSEDTFAGDIFVMNIAPNGTLGWVKKIPKLQQGFDSYGQGVSFNSIALGNELHLFFMDNTHNLNLPVDEPAKCYIEKQKIGILTGVKVSAGGEVKKYDLGSSQEYDTRLFIREFAYGGRNNLISSERGKPYYVFYSLDVKH